MKSLGRFLFGALVFGTAYAQAPLYYSNQNQYFLHGLARAGVGHLSEDWLAKTVSPVPVFDALVEGTACLGAPWLFHVYYAALMGVYWCALFGLFDHLAGERATKRNRLAFSALVILAHCAGLRWLSYRLLGADYPCYLQGWFAAQYALGSGLQPSAFGVFLLLGIERFAAGRPFAAYTAVAVAGIIHPTYLLHGGILALAFCAAMGNRRGLLLLAWCGALVLPVVAHAWIHFGPSNPALYTEARQLLVNDRIPHHCKPRQWFDGIAATQLVFMIVGLWTWQNTRLFKPVAILFLVSTILAFLQIGTDSATLALLFPWRSSVILLPLAVAGVATRFVMLRTSWWEPRIVSASLIAVISACVIAGLAVMATGAAFRSPEGENPILAHIRATAQPGECYLVPTGFPNLGGRGASSSDFKPAPPRRQDAGLIPADFQRFRLATGAPLFIDFKSIPYKDADVCEWRNRVEWVQRKYSKSAWDAEAAAALVAEGITHVVMERKHGIPPSGLEETYRDDLFILYRVRP